MAKPNSAYDDEVTAAEEEELNKLMSSEELPPPDDQQGAPPETPAVEPAQKETEAAPEGEAAAADGDDDGFSEFAKRHEGKSPEELARLAFQQQKRAARSEFDSRKANENLTGVLARIAQARDAKVADIAAKKAAFDEKVALDPDEALREARRETLDREEQEALREADAAEFNARATAAVQLASAAIPDFARRAPEIRDFGVEMGYTPEEVGGIVDGRQIVTLYLAQIAGKMIRSGLIDSSGRFLKLPEPTVEKNTPQPRAQFSRQPARGTQGQKSIEDQLIDVSKMSDADFDKLDPAALDALLKMAEAG